MRRPTHASTTEVAHVLAAGLALDRVERTAPSHIRDLAGRVNAAHLLGDAPEDERLRLAQQVSQPHGARAYLVRRGSRRS